MLDAVDSTLSSSAARAAVTAAPTSSSTKAKATSSDATSTGTIVSHADPATAGTNGSEPGSEPGSGSEPGWEPWSGSGKSWSTVVGAKGYEGELAKLGWSPKQLVEFVNATTMLTLKPKHIKDAALKLDSMMVPVRDRRLVFSRDILPSYHTAQADAGKKAKTPWFSTQRADKEKTTAWNSFDELFCADRGWQHNKLWLWQWRLLKLQETLPWTIAAAGLATLDFIMFVVTVEYIKEFFDLTLAALPYKCYNEPVFSQETTDVWYNKTVSVGGHAVPDSGDAHCNQLLVAFQTECSAGVRDKICGFWEWQTKAANLHLGPEGWMEYGGRYHGAMSVTSYNLLITCLVLFYARGLLILVKIASMGRYFFVSGWRVADVVMWAVPFGFFMVYWLDEEDENANWVFQGLALMLFGRLISIVSLFFSQQAVNELTTKVSAIINDEFNQIKGKVAAETAKIPFKLTGLVDTKINYIVEKALEVRRGELQLSANDLRQLSNAVAKPKPEVGQPQQASA